MTRDSMNVQYPALDTTESVASAAITAQAVTVANGINIKDVFSNKNNSLVIIVNNTSNAASSMTLKAGDAYPNSMLGNTSVALAKGITAVQIQDLSRYEKADGSMDIDFASGFAGNIYAVAKWAGVRPVVS